MTTRKNNRFPLLLALAVLVLSSFVTQQAAAASFAGTGSLNTGRRNHTAMLLPNGKILVVGGYSNTVYWASAELYDPATGIWATTGSLHATRSSHTATLLPNGKVLVAGGQCSGGGMAIASAELYDPASGTWTMTGSLDTGRANHTATLLPNGKVLVVGGSASGSPAGILYSAELYDPASGTWMMTGSLHTTYREYHTATLLPNGKVLVAGAITATLCPLPSCTIQPAGRGPRPA
jgi:WD40 repeat protein